MSALRGKADIPERRAKCQLLTFSGHNSQSKANFGLCLLANGTVGLNNAF